MQFELTNQQRTYLGLEPVESHWDKVALTNEIHLYFDGNTIKKSVSVSENHYKENKMDEETDNREMLLPKTKRGKPKKLNFTSFQSRNGIGTYFSYSTKNGVTIGNYTTQKTYYETYFEKIEIPDFAALQNWLDDFIKQSTEADKKDIEAFSQEERKRVKIKEGDFFKFKVDRRNFGFGRVLLDIRKLRKDKSFAEKKHYGLTQLMGQALVVKVYHIIAPNHVALDELKTLPAFPAQYIMDNRLFYGEFEIIGNAPLEDHEYDFPISYSQSISAKAPDTVYLQWGLIYQETHINQYDKHLTFDNPNAQQDYNKKVKNPYRNESTGFSLYVDKPMMEQCIKAQSNQPFWDGPRYSNQYDLRNPVNQAVKGEIFTAFGLDSSKTYVENLKNYLAS